MYIVWLLFFLGWAFAGAHFYAVAPMAELLVALVIVLSLVRIISGPHRAH